MKQKALWLSFNGQSTESFYEYIIEQIVLQGKRYFNNVEPTSPYEIGDIWTTNGVDGFRRCVTNNLSSAFNDDHWGENENLNIFQVNFSSGLMKSEELISNRTINTTQRQVSSVVDFYSISNSPLSFAVDILFDGEMTEENKNAVVSFFTRQTYKPLIFSTLPDNLYYAIVKSINLSFNMIDRGYFTIEFECNSPYAYTSVLEHGPVTIVSSDSFDVVSNSVFTTQIVKVIISTNAQGDILIKNNANDTELSFSNLCVDSVLTIDCLNHSVSAKNFNDNDILVMDKKDNHSWLELSPGKNEIEVTGNCDVQIFWQGIKI